MKYRTTCPRCTSVFLITPGQLEAAQGWAQCSVCGAAFDARAALADESGNPLPSAVAAPLVETAAASEMPAEISPDEAAPEPQPDTGQKTAPPPQLRGIEQRSGGPDLASIILIDPDEAVPDDYGPLPVFPAEAEAPVESPAAPVAPKTSVYRPVYAEAPTAPHKPVRRIVAPEPGPAPEPPAPLPVPPEKARRPRRLLGVVAILLLVLALVAQTAWFLRDTLASRFPAARPVLASACSALGCRLGLPRDAGLMQIVGSDLQPAGGNKFNLKLTLGNRAEHAQAWPVIVLTLTDQNDQPQARRSFAPSEYLGDPARQDAGIAALSEAPLTLPLAVGIKVAGYRLEVTY